MKTGLKIGFGALILVLCFAIRSTASAATYRGMTIGSCLFVSTPKEKDAIHVYTTNPSYMYDISALYRTYFQRNPRCDEFQFHVDHNTTLAQLKAWLNSRFRERIQTGYYYGQTVSTDKHEWFFIDSKGAHRISDWLTALSYGLLVDDRLTFTGAASGAVYSVMKIAPPLKFEDGQYAAQIRSIWKDGVRDYSSLPTALAAEVKYFEQDFSYAKVFKDCGFDAGYSGYPYLTLLDWRWMKNNPGCTQ